MIKSSNCIGGGFKEYSILFWGVVLLVNFPIKLQAQLNPFTIDAITYNNSLDTFGFDFSPYLQLKSSIGKCGEGDEIPALTSLKSYGDSSCWRVPGSKEWPISFEKHEPIWLYGEMVNQTPESLHLAMYFSIDRVVFYVQSKQTSFRDTIISGDRAILDNVSLTKSIHQSSHLARESVLIPIQAGDTLEILIKCLPYYQNNRIDKISISNENLYFSQFSSTRNNQLTQFWILQGMFWFMVAFSFFMYLINQDRAYLYFSLYALAFTEYLMLTVPTDAFLAFGNDLRIQGLLFNLTAYALPGMFGLFTLTYVHGDNFAPKLKRVIGWALWGTLVCCIVSSIYLLSADISADWYSVMFWMYKLVSSSFGLMGIYALYVYLTADSKLVRYFGIASVFIVGIGLLVLGGNYLFSVFGNISNFADIRLVLAFQVGAMLQLLCLALSLSYRGKLIEQAKNRIEHISEAKSRFLANVSHEFRTPLTLILGPVNELLKKEPEPDAQKQLALIQRNGKRLQRFINQILDLSKLEEGQMKLNPAAGDLIVFVKRITSFFESITAMKEIDLRLHTKEDSLFCVFDQDKLEKVLNNLLSNACKFTPNGGNIAVDVSLVENESIRIQVIDDGSGISHAHQAYIFDRFFQAPSKDFTTKQPSTGIGLAVAKEFVELHGGSIQLESQVEQGTTFTITLPYFPASQDAIQPSIFSPATAYPIVPPSLDSDVPKQTPNNSGLPRLLMVEDNPDVTQYLRSFLAPHYQLHEATDGLVGLETAIETIPDLIISDVMMPLRDGYQLTAALKSNEKTSHIPVIILTGKYSLESKLQGLEVEADAYLTKPFEAEELLFTIQGLLNNRKRLQNKYAKLIQVEPTLEEASASLDELFIQKCLRIVEENYQNEDFGVTELARALGMNRSQLYNKLTALTNMNPSRFIRTIRLKHAADLLKKNSATISEIAFQVGFNSTPYFNKKFKEEFGKTPGEYRVSEGK